MKKNELAKKSRKLFSAILAGAMLTTSAIPESFVWAADVEEVQGFGDSESMDFGSTPNPVTVDGEDRENQEISEFQGVADIQNGNAMVELEEGFTDEIASFGSNGSDTPVESGFQSLESVEELQERINALPTVEEFQNLADGTTVEGSTLNQAQTDVYAEAQDIAEKLDLLSEEELGLVDVSRLEALFGYFNGMTEVLADTPTPIGPVTSGSVTIDHGGTYIIQAGTYTTGTTPIIINTSEDVTLNIDGNIEMTKAWCFIKVKNGSQNVTICNDKYTVNTGAGGVLYNPGNTSTVTFKGGIYTKASGGSEYKNYSECMIENLGTVKFYDVTLKTTGNDGMGTIVDNKNGTVNIYAGTTIDGGAKNVNRPYGVIGGNIYMEGGTITSQSGEYDGIYGNNVKMVGGIIKKCKDAIAGDKSIVLGRYATFENNSADIRLDFEQIFTIQDDFKGNASVFIAEDNPSFPRRITTSGISKSMLGRITSVNGYSVNYAEDGGYLYLWEHTHNWSYSSNDNDNKIIAKCSDSKCGNELELSLTAEDSVYSGEAYNGAEVENNISYATGKKADIVYYLEGGKTRTNASNSGAASEGAAPVNAGKYVVKVSVGGQTISADFKIIKMEINPTVTMDDWTYGQKANTPDITVRSGGSDITALYDASGFTCTYYTDAGCTNMTTAADGAATNGGVPKNAGTYYVKAVVPENGNYAGAEAETSFTIAPLPVNLTWSKTDLIYTGSEQSVSATVANALEGDSFVIVYEGNTQTEAGDSYTATVTDLGNDNYTLIGATSVSQNWSISYLQTSAAAQVSGMKGNNDWYISPVKLVPDSGYQISTDKTDWKDSIGDYTDQGEQSAGYYLKETATGAVTDKKTVTFKIDTGMPSGSIRIRENTFDSSLKDITYGYWLRDNADVDITGADSTSGTASIEYQKVRADESYDVNGTWVTWDAANKLSLTESGKYVIYARITDNAGNQTVINSDGVVVFKDSVVVDSSIDYTRTTKTSVDAEVMLNGNTVASVKNGETTLTAGKDYTVSADKITFSGDYLDTLAVGSYTMTVAYNLQGVTEYKGGDKPADSQITVNVKRRTANIKITSVLDKEYDRQPANLAYTTNSNANVKVEYNVNGTWQTEAPTHAGTYEVKVSVPENGDFAAASDTKTYTIKPREVVISGITANAKVYDGNAKAELDYSKVVFTGLVKGDTLMVSAEGTFADRNAAKGKTVTITNLVLGGVSADNYVLAANGQQTSTTADISPKEITVKITPNGGIYEGTITPATAVLDGLVGEDKPEIILTYTGKANDGTEVNGTKTPVLAGTYTVTVSITDSNYNLKAEGTTAEFVVTKATPGLSVAAVSDKSYGEGAFELGVSNKGDGSKSYASSNDKVVKVDEKGTVTIVGAGTAALTVSLAESANYTADRKAVTVTVAPKEITVTADNQKKIAGEADPVLTYTTDGLVGEDTLSGITVERKAGEKVGTYAVTVSQEAGANPNYRITFKKGTFTIQQADQSKLKGKDVYRLKLPAFFAKGKVKKNSITLSWKKYAGATGYDVYWRYCDGSINYKKVGTVKNGKLSITHKKLKKDREYKYFIAAYKMVEGRKIYIAKSNGVHVAMKQAATTNVASIKVNKKKVTLAVGKTFTLKCEVKAENSSKKLVSHTSSYRYYTTNSKVATVSKAGVIKAKGKGTCSIYVLANNGVYKKVKVKVK